VGKRCLFLLSHNGRKEGAPLIGANKRKEGTPLIGSHRGREKRAQGSETRRGSPY